MRESVSLAVIDVAAAGTTVVLDRGSPAILCSADVARPEAGGKRATTAEQRMDIPMVSPSERWIATDFDFWSRTPHQRPSHHDLHVIGLRQRALPKWAETRAADQTVAQPTRRGSVVRLTFEQHDSTRSRPPAGREAPDLLRRDGSH